MLQSIHKGGLVGAGTIEINFDKKITVIAGDNSSGKSSLLEDIKQEEFPKWDIDKSIADHFADIEEAKKSGIDSLGVDGEVEGEWVVVDMANTMVHIMQQEHRDLYQLEKLWS